MTSNFDITAEKQAGQLHFFKSQLTEEKCPKITTDDVNLTGKMAIVTGGNIGIGLECAHQLLDLGLSKLILAVRNEESGHAAAKTLSSNTKVDPKKQTIEVWNLNLSSYESITKLAENVGGLDARPDIVVLNAGVFKVNRSFIASTGHDEDVQINYLSNILLLVLLLRIVKEKKPADTASSLPHIVFVSSVNAHWAKFEERTADPLWTAFDDKDGKWDMADRYGASKLLVLLFLSELVKKVPPSVAILSAPTPGMCYGSRLARDGDGTVVGFVYGIYMRLIGHSCQIGARTVVDAAVKKGPESHGEYIENGKLRP